MFFGNYPKVSLLLVACFLSSLAFADSLPVGCFKGVVTTKTAQTLLNSPTAQVTVKISALDRKSYRIQEKVPNITFGEYPANPSSHSTAYVVQHSRYHPTFIGRQDYTRPTFSESARPRVSFTKINSNKISYRRTIRWLIGEDTVDFSETAQGRLTRQSEASCDF